MTNLVRYRPEGLDPLFEFYDSLDARTQYYLEAIASGIPIVGSFIQARDKVNYMDDYLSNRGLGYEDFLYPSMTVGYQGVSGLSSFVSSNIERLYR